MTSRRSADISTASSAFRARRSAARSTPPTGPAITPIRIFGVTFGDGSHQQHWAAVSDTGGKAEVLGNSFVGPTDCTAYGGPFCIYPWFSSDGAAINYGVGSTNLGGVDQFAQTQECPDVSVFPGFPTYCDTIIQ
jgi:hypothetical protein